MLDTLLDFLTTHALSKMQPGGGKKTYTSKNIGALVPPVKRMLDVHAAVLFDTHSAILLIAF